VDQLVKPPEAGKKPAAAPEPGLDAAGLGRRRGRGWIYAILLLVAAIAAVAAYQWYAATRRRSTSPRAGHARRPDVEVSATGTCSR